MSRSVAVLCGGVGAARFLLGLIDAVDADTVTAIVNTGDDTVLHGLAISPDLDTITYTLAGATDPERGWGLVDETWRAMGALERYERVRPDGSAAATRWFNLGDQDLATHLYRTARLAEGASLTTVTDEIRRAWNVPVRMLPMTDDRFATIITTLDHGDVEFQDYFVRLRHEVPVAGIRFDGDARASTATTETLADADAIVIAPSNPLVSIGPIRALPAVDRMLAERRDRVVAVSPIVGGAALKGPAARLLAELGHEPSVVGVARVYAPVASALVIDPADADAAAAIEDAGMRAVVVPSIMSSRDASRRLAAETVGAIG